MPSKLTLTLRDVTFALAAILLTVLTVGTARANVQAPNLLPAKDVVVVYPASATSKEPIALNFNPPTLETQPPIDVETPLGQVRAVINSLNEIADKQTEILEQINALNLRIDSLYASDGLDAQADDDPTSIPSFDTKDPNERRHAPAMPQIINDSNPWRPIALFVTTLALLVIMNRLAKRLDDALATAKKARRAKFNAQPLE
ncbi:MAG: hypothetical protein Q4G03_10895 [Planctomycetia bacterium]|nr:hypothetical protein [Planctomycetia bacterium]